MEKSATKTISLTKTDLTITISRSITKIEGDAWEGRPDETLYIEDVKISFIHPVNGKKEIGSGIRKYDPSNVFDAANIKKGAVGEVRGTGLMLAAASWGTVATAYQQASDEAMYPEWQAHIDFIASKKLAQKISAAEKIVTAGDEEMSGGKKLMTAAEIKAWRRNYNNVHNEGGDGYIPDHTSVESYNDAKKILNERK